MKSLSTDWARGSWAGAARSVIQRGGLAPLLATLLDLRIDGRDHLRGLAPPALFIANHSSHLDAPLVLTALPEPWRDRVAVGAAADYFFQDRWTAAATALVFNAFPVERERPGHSPGLGRRLLGEGWSLLVFPEGARSRDGTVGGFRIGAAALAVAARVPVVPIAIRGAYQAMPTGRRWPLPGRPRVSIRFGEASHPADGERPAAFNSHIEARLEALLDEDETTWWDAARRAAKPKPPPRIGPDPARWRRVWEGSRPLAKDPERWTGSGVSPEEERLALPRRRSRQP